MSTRRQRSRLRPTRMMFVSIVAAALLGLLIAALLLPRYRSQIATVDQTHRWPNGDAPPRREIVWQPAVPLTLQAESEQDSVSHIRPQVSDGGDVLYFTIRTAKNDYDIVRSRRIEGGWSVPEEVAELNSDANDVGPNIREDGKQLYLYSNRNGGFGGMDLYVSQRVGDHWTEPVNLGTEINSNVHEYDPAISPDGQRLYYSSNRNEHGDRSAPDDWSTTLRGDPGNRTFDLYVSELDAGTNLWNKATPLDELNTRQHNEGSPFVSPNGAFLFFVSDRPTPRSESRNFDIYRARLDRLDLAAENLGAGINTEANEIEPALASAGFQLHFSRSDPNKPTQYSLHESTAKEIYHDREWQASSWGAAIGSGIKQIFDQLWWILLSLALLAALIWLIREIKVRHVAVPGFLLLAILLHTILVTGSFFVFFQQSIVQRLRELLQEEVVATQVLLSSTSPTQADRPAFDQVADLQMPDPIRPADVSKQSIDVPSDPTSIEFSKPQRITRNAPSPMGLPDDAIVASVPVPDEVPVDTSPLRRAARALPPSVEPVRLEPTVAAEASDVEQLAAKPADIERRDFELAGELVKPIAFKSAARESMPASLQTDTLKPAVEIPEVVSDPIAIDLDRQPTAPPSDSKMIDTPVPSETVAATDAQPISAPTRQNVEVERAEDRLAPTVEQPEPLKLARINQSTVKVSASERVVPIVTELDAGSWNVSKPISAPLKRTRAESVETKRDSPVSTDSIKMIADHSAPAPAPAAATVEVARQATNSDEISIDPLSLKRDDRETREPVRPGQPLVPAQPIASNLLGERVPLAGVQLPRRASKPKREYADTRVNLQSLLLRRKLNEATKVEVVKEFGGNDETLTAIRRGLVWIEQHQERDGRWSIHEFHNTCDGHKKCDGRGNSKSDTAATGLALLPFLGDGNTHQDGPYKDLVGRGITWLVKNQKPDGNLFTGGEGIAFMYSHGIATIALCECYGMTADESLREPCQRAINFIVSSQDPKSGGWRYKPREHGDTSVVGWQVMALKSAQMADLNVPEKSLQGAQRWLEHVAGDKKRIGQFAYQHNRNFNPAMTAEALLCLQYMDNPRESDHILHSTQYLLKNLPKKGRETSYYWYYGTQAMFHLQGDDWKKWNDAIHPLLVETQRKEGPMSGTWDPQDQWEKGGGRIYATSLRVLMLEVYYRHLPIYQVID